MSDYCICEQCGCKHLVWEKSCPYCRRIAELEEKVAYYKKAHTVHKLAEGQDQSAFVFTARLQHVVKEFEGVISTAAAIGAFEVVKHELIAAALEADDERRNHRMA